MEWRKHVKKILMCRDICNYMVTVLNKNHISILPHSFIWYVGDGVVSEHNYTYYGKLHLHRMSCIVS